MNKHIDKAIKLAGSAEKLGQKLNPSVSNQAVFQWRSQGWAPVDRARQIAALYPDLDPLDMVKPDIARLAREVRGGD